MPKLLSLTEWVWIKHICKRGDTVLYIIVFFPCDYGHKSRVSQIFWVPEALRVSHGAPGVRVLYFLFLTFCQITLCLQSMAALKEGDHFHMGVSFVLKYEGQFNLKSSFCILSFCGYVRIISFSYIMIFLPGDIATLYSMALSHVQFSISLLKTSNHHLDSRFWIYV